MKSASRQLSCNLRSFDMNADDAMNYGAIGVVIGHEMTHGFDDQGRQYDKDGNLKDWWTEEDAKSSKNVPRWWLTFDSIRSGSRVHANGWAYFGREIADHGGLQVSFQAFKKAKKQHRWKLLTDLLPNNVSSSFMLMYGQEISVPEEILRLTKLDPSLFRKMACGRSIASYPELVRSIQYHRTWSYVRTEGQTSVYLVIDFD